MGSEGGPCPASPSPISLSHWDQMGKITPPLAPLSSHPFGRGEPVPQIQRMENQEKGISLTRLSIWTGEEPQSKVLRQ